jgi:flavin reductase (DIM6/NTAB) family NADH-FMN oxidoreductase RutF
VGRVIVAVFATLCVAIPLASASPAAAPPIRVEYADPTEATSAAGASVTYHVRAYDTTNPSSPTPITATCDPPGMSGSGDFDVTASFPLGETSVTCTATEPAYSTSFTVHVVDTTAPAIPQPANISTSTTNPSGTAVTWDAITASDVVDGPVTAVCNPASGSTFPIGTTTVTCTATDGHGNSAQVQFSVTVTLNDTEAPTFTSVPGSQTVEATEPGGAAVGYAAPTATDNSGISPTINCDHGAGSLFPLGTTTVTCTATDGAGNAATATFTITVQDTTAPVLSLPGSFQVETESPSGTAVPYSASASDAVSGSLSPGCNPASGAIFPLGTTAVHCSVTDGHGNSASEDFNVTVVLVDHTAPVLSGVPANRVIEANGPGGSTVNFDPPTATDNLDGPIADVACSPGSGSTFPLGTTTVTCSATDAHGNAGTASFSVTVVDTTKPSLLVPSDHSVNATTESGIPASDPAVQAFLSQATAVDIADPHPAITNNAPAFFPVGQTVVTFTATDASGNSVSKQSTLDVRPLPSAGTPQPPPPQPHKPPGDVTNLTATPGDRVVRLSWQTPAGVDHVVVTRALSSGGDAQIVYTGSGTSLTDRGVTNGVEYRYVVVSVDGKGETSAGVAAVALPKRTMLRSPKDGARLRKPPKLVWFAVEDATYYNVQLFRGNVKILSAWPTKPALVLKAKWSYDKRRFRLTPGTYRWYVWPGFGARSATDYGELLGFFSFQVIS